MCTRVAACCHTKLPHVARVCRMLPYAPMNVYYEQSRHFCDRPVCPDPVRELSSRAELRGLQSTVGVAITVNK